MLSSPKVVILAALSFLGAASSSPLVRRDCRPNFQGADLIVTYGSGTRLTSNPADPTSDARFHFQFTGQPANTYLIRPIAAADKVLAASGTAVGSTLHAVDINFNSADPLQLWNVRCQTCGDPWGSSSPFATNCTISLATNNLCLQGISLASCAAGVNDQNFSFARA